MLTNTIGEIEGFDVQVETYVHSYCVDCVSKHIAIMVLDDGLETLTYPDVDCKSILGIDSCKEILL